MNTSIHTIRLSDCYCEHELFRRSVIPHLEATRLRPRVHAIQKIRPMVYRAKVLGRALIAARTDASSLWMLLLGNLEVVLQSTTAATATTTSAVKLPTRDNAVISSTAATASPTTVTATWTASTAGASVAANVGTPYAC